MIDIRTEQILPVKELPAYLEARGLGKRVSMRAVNRWIQQGCAGVRLETVVIDRGTFTSLEAVQRWVEAQTVASGAPAHGATPSENGAPPAGESTPTLEHQASVHLLTEHRVLATDLDRLIETLDHPTSTRAFAAGVLFRAGLRTPEDARGRGLDGLLAIKGLGARSRAVVLSLWSALTSKQSTPSATRHGQRLAGEVP